MNSWKKKNALETVIAKANTIIANKKAALGPDGEDSVDNNRYSAELESINKKIFDVDSKLLDERKK